MHAIQYRQKKKKRTDNLCTVYTHGGEQTIKAKKINAYNTDPYYVLNQ